MIFLFKNVTFKAYEDHRLIERTMNDLLVPYVPLGGIYMYLHRHQCWGVGTQPPQILGWGVVGFHDMLTAGEYGMLISVTKTKDML